MMILMIIVFVCVITIHYNDDSYMEKEDGSSKHPIQYGEDAKQCRILQLLLLLLKYFQEKYCHHYHHSHHHHHHHHCHQFQEKYIITIVIIFITVIIITNTIIVIIIIIPTCSKTATVPVTKLAKTSGKIRSRVLWLIWAVTLSTCNDDDESKMQSAKCEA